MDLKMTSNEVWLVTGAFGFLGGHVCDLLMAQNQQVVAVDNLAWANTQTFNKFKNKKNIYIYNEDIRDTQNMAKILAQHNPQYIIHLAALHFIPTAAKNPSTAMSINVLGTQSLLEAMRSMKNPVKTFWLASTGDVYAPVDTPMDEAETPTRPFNTYGLSKLICEQIVELETNLYPSNHFVIGRLFNLYGIGETNPHIIPDIISQVKKGAMELKLGNVWPTRDMVPVRDAASCAILMCLKAPLLPAKLERFNVATGHSYTIEELVQSIASVVGKKIEIILDPQKVRPVERAHLKANVQKLSRFIGQTPSFDLKKGLKELLDFELN